jgi:uncharacterized tellurite resistance protein B-like protein
MRTYRTNSPQAAARIVALTLVADGHVSSAELDMLERVDAYRRLGIARPEMHQLLQDFCEDLLHVHQSKWTDASHIEPRTIEQMMVEVDDPALRMTVLRLCVAVAEADDHVADGESIVLVSAVEQWGLHRQMLQESTRPDAHLP